MLGAKKGTPSGAKKPSLATSKAIRGPTRRQVIQRVYGDESQDASMTCANKIAEHYSDPKRMPAFLTEHAPKANRAYLLGRQAVISDELQRTIRDIIG